MSFDVDNLIDRLLSVGLSGGVALTKCVAEQEIGDLFLLLQKFFFLKIKIKLNIENLKFGKKKFVV